MASNIDPDLTITESCGNVFLDLGFAPGEAAVLALRADLMARLRLMIETKKWTQSEAAERFGVAQSRISDLVRGKWDRFSLDMLITLAARAGKEVRLELADAPEAARSVGPVTPGTAVA